MRSYLPPGCLSLILFGLLLLLIPLFIADLFLSALGKLGLTPLQSALAAIGIFLGSIFNIPIKRFRNELPRASDSSMMYGLRHQFPFDLKRPDSVLLAVNVGGCLVPLLIAVLQISRLAVAGTEILLLAGVSIAINILVCERLAQPVEQTGIALPALIPAFVAVATALILTPGHAPSVAFSSGVLGPLVGADLLHLREIKKISAGVASIGGAGTFDGIVISSIVATLLA